MSFTLSGHIVNLNVTITHEDIEGATLITSDPSSGQFQIKNIRMDTDMKKIVVTHTNEAEE